MPRNLKGGNKSRRAKNHSDGNRETRKIDSEEGQYYAQAIKALGSLRFMVKIFPNNEEKLAKLAGGIVKRSWVRVDDYLIISTRECDSKNNCVDIIHKYTKEDSEILKKQGLLKNISDETNNTINNAINFNTIGEENDNDEGLDDDDINAI